MRLLAISNDFSLRRFGSRRWNALRRWNYALFVLVAVHGAVYQLLEDRPLPFVVRFGGVVIVLIALQLGGFISERRRWTSRTS